MNDVHKLLGHPDWLPPPTPRDTSGEAYRNDLHGYLWGLALAVALTAVPFGLVYWHAMTPSALFIAIGVLALVQAVVHFRCFLHIHPPHENVDELLLVLFTALILIMMAGGTVWILGNLHSRMY